MVKIVKPSVFDKFGNVREYLKIRRSRDEKRNIGLLVDGPNMLRKEFNVDLNQVKKIIEDIGNIKVAKVFLNQYASEKLIEAITNQGFEVIVTPGDVDVHMAIDAMELIYNPSIDVLAFMTRDLDFLPAIARSKFYGKETIVIGADPGFSAALQNVADYVITAKIVEKKEAVR
jgi:uncharacterized protein (TIGR00288 family)